MEVFTAHSVRGASTSTALRKGVSLADILSTADWSRESTFRRLYYRAVGSIVSFPDATPTKFGSASGDRVIQVSPASVENKGP